MSVLSAPYKHLSPSNVFASHLAPSDKPEYVFRILEWHGDKSGQGSYKKLKARTFFGGKNTFREHFPQREKINHAQLKIKTTP